MKLKISKLISVILVLTMLLSFTCGCKTKSEHMVFFDSMGGTSVSAQVVESGNTLLKPADPQKEGFIFIEWQLENEPYDFNTPVIKTMILTASYKVADNVDIVQVTLDYKNKEPNKTIEIMKGGKLIEPLQPQKKGYTFVGWFLNGKRFNFSTSINKNITLTAIWKADGELSSSTRSDFSTTSSNTTSINTSSPTTSVPPTTSHPPHDFRGDFDDDNEDNIYKYAPKGEVHVLMWRKYHKSEQLLIDQYQKLTKAKIKTTICSESEYPTKLVSMVSSGDSPDIVMFRSNNFPGLVTKSLQPIAASYFQPYSDCWNKNYMDAYKINGIYFGVAMPSSWLCEYNNYVTYYSPEVLLDKCGIEETPYQLYKKGKWNWDTQDDIIRKVSAKGYTGLSLQSYDIFMHSAGEDFAEYDGEKYTNKLGNLGANSLLSNAWAKVATLKSDNCLAYWDITSVNQGKVGLFTGISYGLCNEGDWFPSNVAKNLEAVPVAGPKGGTAYTPVRPMVWGVPKKAKNPEGAAYFLRYFLDVSNYDQSSTFHNKQFEEVYKTITKSSAKKSIMYGWGVSNYVEPKTYNKICDALATAPPSKITNNLNSKKGSVQTGITRANKDIARIKK